MAYTSAQETPVKEPEKKEATQAGETGEASEKIVIAQTGKTVEITQATVPTGIFPMPGFIRHWAGLS